MALNKRMVYKFVLFLSLPTPIATVYCKQRHTNRPLNGFRCNGQPFTSPRGVTQASCVHACVTSPSCSMSYNPVTSACLLAAQPCVRAEKHDDFMLMIFRHQEQVDCIVWVRDQYGVMPDRMLTGPDDAQVGRITVGGNILVGQAYKPGDNWNTYIAYNGNQIVSRNEDLLTVQPNCTVAWVPYKAGDTLPMNAIVTGMLANGRRLYSSLSRHKPAGYLRVGSYAKGDTAAYYAHIGSNAVTEFDVLISV